MKNLTKLLTFSFLMCMLVLGTDLFGQKIYINEIMASNGNTIADEDGKFEAWLELFNGDSVAIDLLNWKITDNANNLGKWVFPSVIIQPGDYLLIFASGNNRKSGPFLHTNFSISAEGEPIILSNPIGNIADQYAAIPIPRDVSYGRIPDGGEDLEFFNYPTPGYSNLYSVPPIPRIQLVTDKNSGFYDSEFYLKFLNEFDSTVKIFYTLDGNNPDTNSLLFQDSLNIYDRTVDSNSISLIRTNAERVASWMQWKSPLGNLFKGLTIKAQAYVGDSAISDILFRSYFIDSLAIRRFSLPIFSITIPPGALYDFDTGIYVAGGVDAETPDFSWGYAPRNYSKSGREWERLGFF